MSLWVNKPENKFSSVFSPNSYLYLPALSSSEDVRWKISFLFFPKLLFLSVLSHQQKSNHSCVEEENFNKFKLKISFFFVIIFKK